MPPKFVSHRRVRDTGQLILVRSHWPSGLTKSMKSKMLGKDFEVFPVMFSPLLNLHTISFHGCPLLCETLVKDATELRDILEVMLIGAG